MDTTPQDLDYFYKNIFPSEQLFAWTQYGSQDPKETVKREYSITLSSENNKDGVFVRYSSCVNQKKFRELMFSRPHGWISKLDIGPKFNGDVSRHKEKILTPEEKELVFDIDMDDYNAVRTCCQDKRVCQACFAFLSAAAKILYHLLTNVFNFQHILFVFSGRRGIHCWISDYNARILTSRQREGLASYLHSGLQENKKLSSALLEHYVLDSSYELLTTDFVNLFKTQQIFHTATQRLDMVNKYFDKPGEMHGYSLPNDTAEEAWESLKKRANKVNQMNGIKRIVLDFLYPRLDIEVSKQFNHLLKSPFCIHPATGKVCVPIPFEDIDTFNPDTVPTLTQLIQEHKSVQNNAHNNKNLNFLNQNLAKYITPLPQVGVLGTSLKKYIEYFTDFVVKVVGDEITRRQEMDEFNDAVSGNW
jgi:DNA primase small subunit